MLSDYPMYTLTSHMLPTKMVAALVDVSVGQLAGWSRSGLIVPISKREGYRGPHFYSWIDYSRARVAKKLLDRGVGRRQLKRYLERLDALIEGWFYLPLDRHRELRLLRHGSGYVFVDGPASAVAEDAAVYEASPNQDEDADAAMDPCLVEVVLELQREGSLAALCRFGEFVTIDPAVQFGEPTVRGTRIQTWVFGCMKPATSPEELVRGYPSVNVQQVLAAIEFERALVD